MLTSDADSDETSFDVRAEPSHRTGSILVGFIGAACFGAAVGIVFWLWWWPHRNGGLDVAAALLVLGGAALVLLVAPHRSSRAWLGLLVAAAAIAVAVYAVGVVARSDGCGDCPPWSNESQKPAVTVPAGQPVPPISGAGKTASVSGVLIDWQPGVGEDFTPRPELILTRCRWTAPGLFAFDFQWNGPDRTEEVSISVPLVQGDLVWGTAGTATVSGPGDFTVYQHLYRPLDGTQTNGAQENQNRLSFTARDATQVRQADCRHPSLDAPLEVLTNPGALEFPDATAGSLQEFMHGRPLVDAPGPQLVLAEMFRRSPELPFDRLLVHPDRSLRELLATTQGPCRTITLTYEDQGEVFAEHGCPAAGPAIDDSVVVPDPVWSVTVRHPVDSARLANESRWFSIDGVVPFEPVGYDEDAYLDGALQNLSRNGKTAYELGRVGFGEGTIMFWDLLDSPSWDWRQARFFMNPVVTDGVPGPPLVAIGASACNNYATAELGDGTSIVVLAFDPTLRFELNGVPIELEPGELASGLSVIQAPGYRFDDIDVFGPDNRKVLCDQS